MAKNMKCGTRTERFSTWGENNSSRLAQSRLKFRQNVTSGGANIDLFDVYKIFFKYHLGSGPGRLTKRYCGVGLNDL